MDRTELLAKSLSKLEARVRALEVQQMPIQQSTANVSDPPTDAQLDSAFGTAAQVGNGFIGLVHDNNQGKLWVAFTVNGVWGYEELTQAT